MKGLLLAVAFVGVLSSCATLAPATCEPPEFDPPAALTCDAAIGAARTALADVQGVVSLRVDYQGICPPNARCRAPDGSSAAVVATLSDGEELYVRVFIDEAGVVQADEPLPIEVEPPIPAG